MDPAGAMPAGMEPTPDLSGLPDLGDVPAIPDLPVLPDLELPELDLPELDLPDLELPELDLPELPVDAGQAEIVGALASTGDLSGVLTDMGGGGDGGGAIEAVVAYVEDGGFDDFTADVVAAEVNEAAADELWDDLA